jgi:uncharacterized YccA/Bax inhibitor family protein
MLGNVQSSNPVLNSDQFKAVRAGDHNVMTVEGTVNKTGVLLGVTFMSSIYAWNNPQIMSSGLWIGVMIVGLVLVVLTYMKPAIAHITAPLYCAAKGLTLGSVSMMMEYRFPGIVTNAMVLTFGLMAVMLTSYKMGLIRATPKLQRMVTFGLMAYFFLFIFSFIAPYIGVNAGSLFSHGPLAIGISLFAVGLGALFLVLDFDEIESSAQAGLPKQHEWLGAFGLMITLIWIYWEMLRLLILLQSSDD